MDDLYLGTAPPLDPEWLQFEESAGLNGPKPIYSSPLDRQPVYAEQCRALNSSMMQPGARDHELSQGIRTTQFAVASSHDGYRIPVLRYETTAEVEGAAPRTIILYIHGGGLAVGEADSEDLSCRRIMKESALPSLTLYSVGYRLMPAYPASICVSDCRDVFDHIHSLKNEAKLLLVGSSSGGQLAAMVSQAAPKRSIDGVVLRCPVTSDACSGMEYVPDRLRPLHTSAWEPSFWNSLLGQMKRQTPRDGLERMPLECPEEALKELPRTWIQVCTNDALYSDGICYAKALEDAGVEVDVDVVPGWPHTFWLKAPQLARALEAERAMLKGLAWVAG